MLSPISPALTGPSASTGKDAMIFMSGSGTAPGITIVGSSPGRQRSMLSGQPSGLASSDIDTSYCTSGGALSAAASSGSSGARSAVGAAAAVLAPITEALE